MKKLYTVLTIVLLSFVSLSAQNFRTGYFLDGYMYKYQLNPAFQGERGFIAAPVIGGTSIGGETNLGMSTFLYPAPDGSLYTALHPDVSNEQFMKNILPSNPLNVNGDFNLLALGFRAKKTYHTLDFSLRTNLSTSLPGDFFRFLKVGGSDGNTVYDLSNLSASLNLYAQAAYGFSIKIQDFMSVGLRAKFLLGLASVESHMTDLQLSMNQDKWMVNAGGQIIASSMFAGPLEGADDQDIMNDMMAVVKNPSMGAAFDLGVSVDFLKHFTVSASVLDLGFISWKNPVKYNYESSSWEYTGFENISTDGSGGSGENIEDQLDQKLDELTAMFNFEDPEHMNKHIQRLGFTSLLGLEFRMPFYERLTIGALGTHRFEGPRSWTEGRFSLNLAPLRWLSLSANYAISTFGQSYGAALNIHPTGFNLFLGLDSFKPLLNISKQFIPIDEINTNLKFGITFPFGKYNGRYPKKEKVEAE